MSIDRKFRSRLATLPVDAKVSLGEIPCQIGMLATSRKNMAVDVLKYYKIPFLEAGTGTNRFIIKYDEFAIKIALDEEGIADNIQEWSIADDLNPDIAYPHEISRGGHLLVSSYNPAFTSYAEMMSYQSSIKRILRKWSERYLLGDVGINRDNYANWGLSNDGRPVCIDYAYIFPANVGLFKCICGSERLNMDPSFSTYTCPNCKHEYQDRDIRMKISKAQRMELFKSISGIEMRDQFEIHQVSDKYIIPDTNPDLPDIYTTALNASKHIHGKESPYFI